jgi:fructose-1,6-bisphosphatase/inositol monophosphatase family enzyme
MCELQDTMRARLVAARDRPHRSFAGVAAVTAADTIYEIDRVSEAALVEWLGASWPKSWPVEIIMEGIEEELTFPLGTPVKQTQWKMILDPIDGTRGLMHDKRSGWSLAGLAPQRGKRNHLGDIVVAAMTELPISRQWRADQFSVVRGTGKVVGTAHDVRAGTTSRLKAMPSPATDFQHGFATVDKFIPVGAAWLGAFEEKLWEALGLLTPGSSEVVPVFEDQYIASGGQIAEILSGRDRMVIDVRPDAYIAMGLNSASLCSHPYDLCTELILREAGGVVETPRGKPLRSPLDVTSPVSWVAYANPVLARRVRPVLRSLLSS